ncbi:MAG: hypothetical protein IJM27_01695 [Eubacterium sp.]|nr:hypothetical protein [Eubacterium sp.]
MNPYTGEPNEFDKALADFVNDVASGDAIRHLADQGMTVREIAEHLSFPAQKQRIAQTVWKHFVDTGRIRLHPPEEGKGRKVSYVRDEGAYGRSSFRRVIEEFPIPEAEYIRCDFGRKLYKDEEGFRKALQALSEADREYILDLPWPLTPVWHILDERMKRIMASGMGEVQAVIPEERR